MVNNKLSVVFSMFLFSKPIYVKKKTAISFQLKYINKVLSKPINLTISLKKKGDIRVWANSIDMKIMVID